MKLMNAPEDIQVKEPGYDVSRRRFFQLAGGVAGAGIFLASCKGSKPTDTYIGTEDFALLNFLYILQQLEAAFYTQAVATPELSITKDELLLLTDVRDQEIAHAGFLKTLLGKNAIPAIAPNFSSVTFVDRTSVYTFAAMLEDLCVSGIISACTYFENQAYALEFAKMATVEARHSAYFRDALTYNSFADGTVIDSNGLDMVATSPRTVLAAAENYIFTHFDSSKLPG